MTSELVWDGEVVDEVGESDKGDERCVVYQSGGGGIILH